MAARVRARRSEPISARLARFTRAIAVPTCVWSRLYGQNDFCRPGGFVPRSGFDARFFGSTTGPLSPGSGIPVSVTTHHNSDYRLQLYLNWAWNRALTTAIGYEGWFGGLDHFSSPLTGTANAGQSNDQRLRGAVAMFWSPRIQTVLEVNGDVARTGGFKQTVGTTLRVLYIF